MSDFTGRTAIVTGASRGIGRTTTRLLLERGARVVLVGRDVAALRETAGDGDVAIVTGDIAVAATGVTAVAAALDRFGRLDCLLNVAGAFPTALLEDTGDADYAAAIAANLTGTFMLCRAAAPALKASGQGAIINISSTAARVGTTGLSVYGAAKAGVEAFTRAIAIELAPAVRANCVSAGPTLTDAVAALMASDTTGAVAAVTTALPLARLGRPEEIAEAALFLCSPRSGFTTGQVFHVNGGGHMA